MQDDPWSRRRTVKVIAIFDMVLAFFLVTFSVIRLLQYDYKNQSIVYFLHREQHIFFSLLYWILNFGLLSLQLVIAFFLLTATIDMTTDPETMMSKCIWWRTLSILFFFLLFVELSVVLYESVFNDLSVNIFRTVVASVELIFRGYGVFFVGIFIGDLHSLFETPMVQIRERWCDSSMPSPSTPSVSGE